MYSMFYKLKNISFLKIVYLAKSFYMIIIIFIMKPY